MEEPFLSHSQILRQDESVISSSVGTPYTSFNPSSSYSDRINREVQSHTEYPLRAGSYKNQPLHTINHLARLNHLLAEQLILDESSDQHDQNFHLPIRQTSRGSSLIENNISTESPIEKELLAISILQEPKIVSPFKYPSEMKIISEYFDEEKSNSSQTESRINKPKETPKTKFSKLFSSSSASTTAALLKNEIEDEIEYSELETEDINKHSGSEMRHALLETPIERGGFANFSHDKFCVVSQCFWPDSFFSRGFCVNYENLEMLKLIIYDLEDVEEYLEEFYYLHGFNRDDENVQTELFICDSVYMCIFNRHEYYFAKYREHINHFGVIDLLQLREKKSSTTLSRRQFIFNCFWVFLMTVVCCGFISLFCMTIWITEGTNELKGLQKNQTTLQDSSFSNNTSYTGNNGTQYSLLNLPKWNYLSSLYFSAVTMLTIGYGDYSPETIEGQVLVVIHALVGIIWVSLLISIIGRRLLQNITFILHIISKFLERILRLFISRTKLRYIVTNAIRKLFTNPFAQLIYFIIFLLTYCVIGASVFMFLENSRGSNWTFWKSFYFTVISLTTIGYGDTTVTSRYHSLIFVKFTCSTI